MIESQHQAIWHEHTVKRSAFATISAETRPFIIITTHPSFVLVAPPCDEWLESLQHLTLLQLQDPAAHDAAASQRDAVDATPLVTPQLLIYLREKPARGH